MRRRFLVPVWAILAIACSAGDARPRASIVDSVVPIDTALARFRQGMAEPAGLQHGGSSLDELIASFADRLERRDTVGLRSLALTVEEFAYLYYPTVPEARPPYELRPGLLWFMIEGNSASGFHALLEERGGRSLGYAGYRCPGHARKDGENTVWTLCVVRRLQAPGDTVEERLFGPILERHGRFKFVTFANKL
jgi:hypothetical protein